MYIYYLTLVFIYINHQNIYFFLLWWNYSSEMIFTHLKCTHKTLFFFYGLRLFFCRTNDFKMHPNWFSGSLSLQCRLQLAQRCRFNWKQCNVEVGTPSSLSLRCRWPCIFSFKWCLCERERTGLLADRWLRALGPCVDLKCIWWAPPSPVISCSRSALDGFLIFLARYPPVVRESRRKIVPWRSIPWRMGRLIKCLR